MPSLFRAHLQLGPSAPDPVDDDPAEVFHVHTRLYPGALGLGADAPGAYTPEEERAMLQVGRRFTTAPTLALPPPTPLAVTLDDALGRRRTRRTFGDAPIPLQTLSRLLFHAAGITGRGTTQRGEPRAWRAAPSAGALYPTELYLGIRNVAGLEPCLAHYQPEGHHLEVLDAGDPLDALEPAILYRDELRGCALVVVFASVHVRTRRKYGARGYRYALLDLGHLAQNLCLSAAAQDLACLTSCGFHDDVLDEALGLHGLDESSMYVAMLGMEAR